MFIVKQYSDLEQAQTDEIKLINVLGIDNHHVTVKLFLKLEVNIWGLYLSDYALEKIVDYLVGQEEDQSEKQDDPDFGIYDYQNQSRDEIELLK